MATKRDGLYKRKGSRFWWVRTDPLDRVPRSTGCTDLEAARLWRASRERAAADPAGRAAAEALLGDWVDRVVAMKGRDGSSPSTVEMYEQKFAQILRVWGRDCTLASIETTKVDEYVKTRRGEGISEHTISKEWGCLLRLLKLAKRAKCYAHDLDTLRPPDLHTGYVPRKRKLTREEVVRLLAALPQAEGALVALCIALGCRRSEGLSLLPFDVDLERGQVYVRGTKTDESDRYVPILSVFRSLVEQARPYLPFQLAPHAVNQALKRACEKAGIAHCSFNDLRRTHASLLLAARVDNDTIRRLLGHTTTKLVDNVYGQLSAAELADLAEPKLLSAAPVLAFAAQVRDSELQAFSAEGRPQRESNPRYRRERPIQAGVWRGRKSFPRSFRRPRRAAEAGGRPGELADPPSTLQPETWALALAAHRMGVISAPR